MEVYHAQSAPKVAEVPNNLEIAEKAIWIWNNKPIQLKDLHYNQLCHILNILKKYPRNYFGQSPQYWESAIKMVIKHNYLERFRDTIVPRDLRILTTTFLNKFPQLKVYESKQ